MYAAKMHCCVGVTNGRVIRQVTFLFGRVERTCKQASYYVACARETGVNCMINTRRVGVGADFVLQAKSNDISAQPAIRSSLKASNYL